MAAFAASQLGRPDQPEPRRPVECPIEGWLAFLGHRWNARDAAVGFGGGLVGGLTAMPGALPTIWCYLCGMPNDQQRGLVQP